MLESRVYANIDIDTEAILDRSPFIDPDEAVIMASTYELIRLFDDFIENVLLVRYAESDKYGSESSIHEFVMARNQILILLMDIGLAVSRKYPNVARVFFSDRIDNFKDNIKAIKLDGDVKDIYDLQADFHLFYRLIEGGISSNQLEQALKSFEGLAPDARKMYMFGISKLGSRAKTGRYIFDAMVGSGRGVPMTIGEIAKDTGKSRNTVKKGIGEILDNAGHMIRVEQRGQVDTYFIPEEYRRLHIR